MIESVGAPTCWVCGDPLTWDEVEKRWYCATQEAYEPDADERPR